MATKSTLIPKRTVAIIGKPGVGKSTIANKILQTDHFPICTQLEGVTRPPNPIKSVEKYMDRGFLYEIYVIDVDSRSVKSGQLGDDMIQKLGSKGIGLILFVYKADRFTDEEKKLFEKIINRMPKSAEISALIITNCEDLPEESREDLILEFKTNKFTARIASHMRKGIFTVGFPNLQIVKPSLKEIYGEDIEKDRDQLHKTIDTCGLLLTPQEIFDVHSPATSGHFIKCPFL